MEEGVDAACDSTASLSESEHEAQCKEEFYSWYDYYIEVDKLDCEEKQAYSEFKSMSLEEVQQEMCLLERDKKTNSAASEAGAKARRLIKVLELVIRDIEYVSAQSQEKLAVINSVLIEQNKKPYKISNCLANELHSGCLPWVKEAISNRQLYILWYETTQNNKLIAFVEYDEFEKILLHGSGLLNWIGTKAQFRLFTWMLPLETTALWKMGSEVFLLKGKPIYGRYKSGSQSPKTARAIIKLMQKSFGKEVIKNHVNPEFTKYLKKTDLQHLIFN